MQWTTMALLEVLGVLVGSSPCQRHMSVPSDSLPQQLGHIAPHHIDILGYNPHPTSLTSYLIIIENVDWVLSRSHVGHSGV